MPNIPRRSGVLKQISLRTGVLATGSGYFSESGVVRICIVTAAIPGIPRAGAGTVIYGRVSRRRWVDSISDTIVAFDASGGSDG